MVKRKKKLDMRLIIVGLISTMFATFSLMCIPCIMAANPSLVVFFAFLGALSILLARYSWVFLITGVLLIAVSLLLQPSRRKKCG